MSYLLTSFASVLWRCWLGSRKGIRPVKNWVVGCWQGYLSGAGADLHMAQLMPLPLTVSCFSKIQIMVLFFWYRLTRVVPDKGPLNGHVSIYCSSLYLNSSRCLCRLLATLTRCRINISIPLSVPVLVPVSISVPLPLFILVSLPLLQFTLSFLFFQQSTSFKLLAFTLLTSLLHTHSTAM